MIPLESCTGGHKASKSSLDSKIMGYNPRKRPEWPKSQVLPIPLESCTGGHRESKSSRDSKIMGYNPRKLPEMLENTIFAAAASVVYWGSHGIEILPEPKIVG